MTFLEHNPPLSSGGEGDRESGEVKLVSAPLTPAPTPALAPSLTPASQPTISLLTDNNADNLSVDSLTLLPPAESPHLHPYVSHTPATHSLQKIDASIAEVEEEEKEEGQDRERGQTKKDEEGSLPEEEEESPLDETETDATVKEENTTTELVTPTDEAPDGEDTCSEMAGVPGGESETTVDHVDNREDEELDTETLDSPELD